MTDLGDVPSDILDDIAYLSRSPNRIKVLDALIAKPRSPRALREATGTSKTTLNRILNEFEERSWAWRTADGRYEATPQAEHILVQITSLIGSMETIRDLGENIAVLPAEEMRIGSDSELTVELTHFRDATVKQQRPQAQGVGRDHLVESARDASSINVLTNMAPPRILGRILQDRVVGGDLSGTLVFTGDLIEYLRDHPETPPRWDQVIEAGCEMYRCEEPVPANFAVLDESTLVWGPEGEMRRRVIISQNETVRTWALDVIGRYRERADLLDPAVFV